jgi:hypothetical protein
LGDKKEKSSIEKYAEMKLKQEQLKGFSTLITFVVVIFLIVIGIIYSLI